MKKSNFKKVFLLFVLALFVISCSKDETLQYSSAQLIGEWDCTSVKYTGTSVTEFLGQSIKSDFVGEGYDIDFTFTLSENPNVATSNGSYNIELTATTQGQTSVQNVENIAFNLKGDWKLDGNKMTITQGGESSVATIVELTETMLELNLLDERTISSNGATVTATTDSYITFIK